MRKVALAVAGMLCAALNFVPLASADPDPGHVVTVTTPVPPMRCAVDSDDSDQRGPAVVCQAAGFPQAPMDPVHVSGVARRSVGIASGSGHHHRVWPILLAHC
jgi:hypothetical protein